MIFNITSALDKTSCVDYVDFGKNADRFGRTSLSQIEKDNQKYLVIQLKVFQKDDKGDFPQTSADKVGGVRLQATRLFAEFNCSDC